MFFSNRPGGGLIVLGLDEHKDFSPVKLENPNNLSEALTSKARSLFDPPIILEIDIETVKGMKVIVASVPELDLSQKPSKVVSGKFKGVWVRALDGDYKASGLEIQGLLANKTQPNFDAQPVEGTSVSDLDENLVNDFISTCHSASSQLSKIKNREELLWRMGVLVGENKIPSVAGLLALGIYPQQYLPVLSVQAVLKTDSSVEVKADDSKRFDGPIPYIFGDVLSWVSRNTPTKIAGNKGAVKDQHHWPLDAIRELISNILIHRDLSQWGLTESCLIRIDATKLIVKNPGGLYGLTVDRLGKTGVSSARNTNLLRICQYVRMPDGRRVVEALATGIPTILRSLEKAEMPEPTFYDDGLRFTAILRQPASTSKIELPTTAQTILETIGNDEKTVNEIAKTTKLKPANIRKHLRNLREKDLIEQIGGQGKKTQYKKRP